MKFIYKLFETITKKLNLLIFDIEPKFYKFYSFFLQISVSAVNISISYNEPDLDIFSLRIIDYELDKFNDFVILKEWKHVSVFHGVVYLNKISLKYFTAYVNLLLTFLST